MTTNPNTRICRDRLTGVGACSPEELNTLIGRWVLDIGGQEVFVNSAPAARGDFLVPEPSGHWYVLTESGQRLAGSIARAQLPDELGAESVRTIGEKLEQLVHDGAPWLEWIHVVPLVPGISEQVDIQPLELLIREHFGHLEAVCHKPRAHLQVEVERIAVSKARRIPPAAAAYLASHTEDWDRPLLRGILPKRILAEVRQDQLDIYENRVAARLLDNLSAYLNRRIRVLQCLLKVFQEKEDYSSSIAGTYQRERRISELWGESIDTNEGRKKAEATLKELEWLKYKLKGLLGSTLYEEVPRRAYVPTTLKNTNVLTNDQHYRRVADLWREWAKTGAGRTQNPAELHAEAQRLCRGMDAFAMLLIVRALDELGYEPSDGSLKQAIARGVELKLRGHGVEIAVRWCEDGTVSVMFDDRELAIVTLTADLGLGTDEQVASALTRIHKAATDRAAGNLLVLFLASDDERASLDRALLGSLHTVGNDPRNALSGGGCLPVSPWEIGSTERVARALRWFLTSARFSDYPLQVEVPSDARGLIDRREHARWLMSREGGGVLELRSPPQDFEWELLGVASMVETAAANTAAARSAHQRISDELRRAVREGRTGTLNRQKHEAHEEVLRCERVQEAVEQVAEALRDVRNRSVALLVCPSCGVTADPARDFEPRDRGCFRCACPGCGTEWATRLCGEGHRYAVMLPSGDFVDTDDSRPGWEDRIYGCDILALPARKLDGHWGFACPECGQVS